MASLTSKPPSKPVQALTTYGDAALLHLLVDRRLVISFIDCVLLYGCFLYVSRGDFCKPPPDIIRSDKILSHI